MSRPNLERAYPYLFLAIVAAYCLVYAPYGINETDNGFLTGLAWQLLCGKTLYHDVLYVRPPLPVWMRAGELMLLPENWSILGERYIFYFKVALYTWLAADLLEKNAKRWLLAIFGFIVSVHSYPACAWHSVDGILFAVSSVWFYKQTHRSFIVTVLFALLAGKAFVAALLCKQSFYPLAAIFPILFLTWQHRWRLQRLLAFSVSAIITLAAFLIYLSQNELLDNYLHMTGGAASAMQAVQHGLLDYFRIKPVLIFFTILSLLPVFQWIRDGKNAVMVEFAWGGWLSLLLATYVLDFWLPETFAVPFSQSRLMFLVAVFYAGRQVWLWLKGRRFVEVFSAGLPENMTLLLLLLAVSWSAAVSWGYNLPIFLATPWVFVAMTIGQQLWQKAYGKVYPEWRHACAIVVLLLIGRCSYEYVYRDGKRSEMTVHLGAIFPKLQGIYSSPGTAALYAELDSLSRQYQHNFVVLPSFPQAHFLTGACSPLPLDWVVKREMNGDNSLIVNSLQNKKLFLFVEKSAAEKIRTDPEMEPTRNLIQRGTAMGETTHFQIMRYE